MGHCEMLLAVAGLDKTALDERTRRLASGDWSPFPPGDRAAFLFARKQAREPWSISSDDMQRLTDHFVDGGGRKGQQPRGDDGRHPIVADVIGRRRYTRQAGEHTRKRLVSFPLLHFSPVLVSVFVVPVVVPSFSSSALLESRRPPLTTASRSRSPRFDLSSTSSAPTSSASQRGMVSP